MLLEFKTNHKSVTKFNSVELPSFTVLTGVNGSGKSHLLTAIEQRDVEIKEHQNANIIRFDYETFRLENENPSHAHQMLAERKNAWDYLQGSIKSKVLSWKQELGDQYDKLAKSCKERKLPLWNHPSNESLRTYKERISNLLKAPQLIGNQNTQIIYSIAKRIPFSLDEITYDDFIKLYKPYTFKNDFLPMQLGKIFWEYYINFHDNELKRYDNEKYDKKHRTLTEKEFFASYGEKPWELINEILEKFGSLDYKFSSPEGSHLFGDFLLKLIHTKNQGVEIAFSDLSSGEKILMALVASIYKTLTDIHFPDVLLLDEVDASLHPSMIKNMLNVIKEVFLGRGIKVILVTHAPTTIALAPEESIFVMNKSGLNRIEKKSRQEALSILTEGFATLDEGIRLFDEVSKQNISIITEGNNANLIQKACELYKYPDVEVVKGAEDISGKNQLKTLFEFFTRATHDKKVVFIWDCDVNFSLSESNNTYPYFIEKNTENSIATKGIENLFPEGLFENFKTTIKPSIGEETVVFDNSRKRHFETFILDRNNKDDFINFKPLFDYIDSVKSR